MTSLTEDCAIDATSEPRSRAERNTQALRDAARDVFARSGFYEARIVDVVTAAGVGVGTFYRHFGSKTALLAAVLEDVIDDIYNSGARRDDDPEDTAGQIAASNRRFLELYRRHAPLLSLLEQLAPQNEQFGAMFLSVRERAVERQVETVERLQREGVVSAAVDARRVAGLLVAMTNAQAHIWFTLGEPTDTETDIAALTHVWTRALGLS
ncbi:TetR/AcrR family transcriptional regulator [Pseudonocardia xishanensis]|uniref:TetR/AcrR family transcriptional regulator n=1 Tax=Pseudonocardia xishanensis TaxID=630995 RepID=A0ABP8RQH3_9PSEU